MAANIPFFRGQNVVLRLYQNGKPVYIACKNWDVSEESTENADGVNGEHRDRLDKVVNYFKATFDVFQTDQEVLSSYMASIEADDNNLLPLKQTMAIQINHRDGTRAAYLLQECKLGPIKMTNSSRQEAVMLNVSARFRDFKAVPTI